MGKKRPIQSELHLTYRVDPKVGTDTKKETPMDLAANQTELATLLAEFAQLPQPVQAPQTNPESLRSWFGRSKLNGWDQTFREDEKLHAPPFRMGLRFSKYSFSILISSKKSFYIYQQCLQIIMEENPEEVSEAKVIFLHTLCSQSPKLWCQGSITIAMFFLQLVPTCFEGHPLKLGSAIGGSGRYNCNLCRVNVKQSKIFPQKDFNVG